MNLRVAHAKLGDLCLHEIRSDSPFDKNQVFIFGPEAHGGIASFGPCSADFAALCIPEHGRYLEVAVLLAGKSDDGVDTGAAVKEQEGIPSNSLNLGDFTWIEDRVCNATERRTDIER